MRAKLIGSSAALLAFLVSGAVPAAACDWGCGGPVYTYGQPPIYVGPPRVYYPPPLVVYPPIFYGRPYRARYDGRPWRGSYGFGKGLLPRLQQGRIRPWAVAAVGRHPLAREVPDPKASRTPQASTWVSDPRASNVHAWICVPA